MKKSPSAFTLFELIAVIAIIAVIGSFLVVSATSILRGIGERPVEEVFKLVVREARFLSAANKETVSLHYNYEEGRFEVLSERGGLLYTRASGYGKESPDLDVLFHQRISGPGLDPDSSERWEETHRVFFRPDRSSTPFEVEFDLRDGSIRQRYDPFSDIVIEDSSR